MSEQMTTADNNVMPLILTINEFMDNSENRPLETNIIVAAVHGWMEGHLAAPGHHLDPERAGEQPNSPWPSAHDPKLKAIGAEVAERFQAGEEPAAIACAVALGWQAGRQAGMDCPGCSPKGGMGPLTEELRGGRMTINFVMKDGSSTDDLIKAGLEGLGASDGS